MGGLVNHHINFRPDHHQTLKLWFGSDINLPTYRSALRLTTRAANQSYEGYSNDERHSAMHLRSCTVSEWSKHSGVQSRVARSGSLSASRLFPIRNKAIGSEFPNMLDVLSWWTTNTTFTTMTLHFITM